MRFIVYEVATEEVTYTHVIDADSPEEAKRIVEEERSSDQGEWGNTETTDRQVRHVEELPR